MKKYILNCSNIADMLAHRKRIRKIEMILLDMILDLDNDSEGKIMMRASNDPAYLKTIYGVMVSINEELVGFLKKSLNPINLSEFNDVENDSTMEKLGKIIEENCEHCGYISSKIYKNPRMNNPSRQEEMEKLFPQLREIIRRYII